MVVPTDDSPPSGGAPRGACGRILRVVSHPYLAALERRFGGQPGPDRSRSGGAGQPDEVRIPVRHPGRGLMTCVVLVLLAMAVHGLVTNSRYQWAVVGDYFFSHEILSGLLRTLELTALAMTVATALGIVLALMRQSGARIVSLTANAYIWFFRGTPLLVQLIFWYNISALYPSLSIGIPFGPAFVRGNANSLVGAFAVAVIGLGLNEGAYMCEVVRGGLLSVEKGQIEAATALGMTSRLTFQKVVFPQAIRVMIPSVGNELIGMLKYTSLVSVLSLPELLYSAQIIYSQTFQTMPLLIVASLWYLIVTTVLTIGQAYVERYYGRGTTGAAGRRRRVAENAGAAGRRRSPAWH